MSNKQNCWQFMKCGREPGGPMIDELGICPASIDVRHDGINGGNCAGRFCWYVSGTFCNGEVQGSFAKKLKDCLECPFLKAVGKQEGIDIIFVKEDMALPR